MNTLFWEIINNNGVITERSNLSPIDKIKIHEYEVKRAENVVASLEEKLEAAKKSLADKIAQTNSIKKEAVKFLDDLKKEIK